VRVIRIERRDLVQSIGDRLDLAALVPGRAGVIGVCRRVDDFGPRPSAVSIRP